MTTGFEYRNNLLQIDKDYEAVLSYTFEWNEWLEPGDAIFSQVYSIQTRSNDPRPLVIVSQGTTGTKTYVQLSGGALDKVYTVTVKIVTTDGLTDRRSFKIRVINRSA